MPESPLSLSPDQMRRTGHAVVDALVDLVAQRDPVLRRATPEQMAALLHTPPPEHPTDLGEVLRRLVDDVFPYASRVGHPGYFAYVPGSTTWPAVLAEALVMVAHQFEMFAVAEGVETEAEAALLRGLGIDCLQGYLFGRPKPTL